MSNSKSTPGDRLLARRDLVLKGIDYHPNHLRQLWQRGDFPAPFKLSPRKLVWRESVVDAWLAAKTGGA
jgi:Prophage CP4-57 regulatory protein (AlpA)